MKSFKLVFALLLAVVTTYGQDTTSFVTIEKIKKIGNKNCKAQEITSSFVDTIFEFPKSIGKYFITDSSDRGLQHLIIYVFEFNEIPNVISSLLKRLFTIELKEEEYDPMQEIPLQYANKNLFFAVWGYNQDDTATLKKKFLDVFTAGEIKVKDVKIEDVKAENNRDISPPPPPPPIIEQ